ncbi:TetR/AcrR family transcriptional regulator [Nocardioides sp. Kera G14]|uniref:TetR/AcrR family transcriptional regulator n=1 Tax=Nocardioides sp. Kera G14 TaxID=2884264 RepID=UPI001D128F4C|nr:TetR/AcrR family transcriptional regulator [Nocardioides sp. Kera G14]UDY24022.1 TetR/AcrR family transcriptional regulator [Nocardioides sp. Kera G14]
MARPRLHSLDDLLDVAEQLVTVGDPAGLTLRTLATSAGASNGTIYHAFRSKEELLARLWLRATERLGVLMEEAIREVGEAGEPQDAVVAVALSPVRLAQRHASSARLFFGQRSDQLFSADLAPEVVDELAAQQKRFTGLLVALAQGLWDRRDGVAVEAVVACVVDVPGGLLRRLLMQGREPDQATEERIEAAVRAILSLPLDPPRKKA